MTVNRGAADASGGMRRSWPLSEVSSGGTSGAAAAGRGVLHTVGISDLKVSTCPQDVLVTYSLGSCLGLSLWEPTVPAGGLLHCMLPLSDLDPEKARLRPAMFADTGVTGLLEAMEAVGARRSRLVARVAGCGSPLDEGGLFKIGERNYAVLRKILWKHSILLDAEDVGGPEPRTLYLDVGTGKTVIRSRGKEREL